MVKGLYTAYTGMANEQKRLDVLANNLANSNTTGYKKEGLIAQSFKDQLAIKIKDTSEPDKAPKGIGYITFGVKVGETYTDWDQGSMQITDRETDLALSGKGFFAIQFTNKRGVTSTMYTRDGAFTVNMRGEIVTSDGDYLLNQAGQHVTVNPDLPFVVDEQGQIYQNNQVVGNVGVFDFANYDYLEKYGENLYRTIDGAQIIAADATVQQGCLESSNINVVDEMVNMIEIARAYEAGQKVIQTEDSTLDKAVNDVGRV